MFNAVIENKYFLDDTDGIQKKAFYDNHYYKLDKQGAEGISEELVSLLLSYSNLKEEEFVKYEYGKINNQNGCKSLNFLNKDEEFYNFNELHLIHKKERLDWHIRNFSMKEKIEYTISFIKEICNLDVADYLKKCVTLDYIVKNIDRHFSNLGIIFDSKNDIFKPAPIFDNGASLMSTMSIMRTKSINENLEELKAKPFSDNINEMYEYFGTGFQVNFKELLKELEEKYDIKDKEYGYEQLIILKHQANKLLNSELNLENSLDVKISTLKAEYKIENGKLVLNEAAQKECDKLIEQGIIKDARQYPMYKDMQR